MNILVSQPQPTDVEKSPYGDLTRKYNVQIDFFKFIKIEGIPAKEFRQSRINLLIIRLLSLPAAMLLIIISGWPKTSGQIFRKP